MRWPVVLLLALVGVGIAVAVAIAIFLRPEAIAEQAARQVRAATGRELAIGGPLSYRLFPSLAVTARAVSLSNAPWGSRPDMARIDRIALAIGLLPLLQGRIEVDRLELAGADLLLETDASGKGNWVFEKPVGKRTPEPAPSGESGPILRLGAIDVDGAVLTMRDGSTGKRRVLAVERAVRRIGDRLDTTELAASFDDVPFKLTGTTGPLEDLFGGASDYPVDVSLEAKGARAKAKGLLHPGTKGVPFELEVSARVEETSALSTLIGELPPPVLPLEIGGTLARSAGVWAMQPLQLSAGGQRLDGSLTVREKGPRTVIGAELRAEAIDLARLRGTRSAAGTAGGKADASARVLDDTPLSLAPPAGFDAELALRLGRLLLPGGTVLGGVETRASLQSGTLTVEPIAFGFAGGNVSARLSLRASGEREAAASLALEARNIPAAELLALVGKKVALSGGATALTARLETTGASPHGLAAGATGDVLVQVGPGSLDADALGLGGDVLSQVIAAVNPFKGASRATQLHCAVARLPVRKGVIEVDRSIAFETSRLDAAASGTIDLRREALSLGIRPRIKEGLGIGTAPFAQLVRLEGSFREPRVAVDAAGVARGAISAGAAAASGGASLVFEQLLGGAQDPHPCQTALGRRSKAGPEPRGETPAKAPAAPRPVPEPFRDLFKGLLR